MTLSEKYVLPIFFEAYTTNDDVTFEQLISTLSFDDRRVAREVVKTVDSLMNKGSSIKFAIEQTKYASSKAALNAIDVVMRQEGGDPSDAVRSAILNVKVEV